MTTEFQLPPADALTGLPVRARGRLLGLLFVQGRDQPPVDSAVLDAVANHLEAAIGLLRSDARPGPDEQRDPEPLRIHFCPKDSGAYVNGQYLIKGVAGALLRKLLKDYVARGRTEFSTRELRHEPTLKLPDLDDNLGARLVLLRRRLEQQCPDLRIERTGRGRFRLVVKRLVQLADG